MTEVTANPQLAEDLSLTARRDGAALDALELAPCPFQPCDGVGELICNGPTAEQAAYARSWGHDTDDCSYFVQCTKCGATGPETACKREAMDRWNRRS